MTAQHSTAKSVQLSCCFFEPIDDIAPLVQSMHCSVHVYRYVEDSPFYIMTCSHGGILVQAACGLLVIHVLTLMSVALYLAYKTRNSMPGKYKSFRESYHIFLAVVNISFMLLLTAPVLLTTHDPFTTYAVCSLSFIFSSVSGVGIIFLPKVCIKGSHDAAPLQNTRTFLPSFSCPAQLHTKFAYILPILNL